MGIEATAFADFLIFFALVAFT